MAGLDERAAALIRGVLAHHPEVAAAYLFGSRALGTQGPSSDVDLALDGDLDEFDAARILGELDELPLPYKFDVKALGLIRLAPLRRHIEQFGQPIYTRK